MMDEKSDRLRHTVLVSGRLSGTGDSGFDQVVSTFATSRRNGAPQDQNRERNVNGPNLAALTTASAGQRICL